MRERMNPALAGEMLSQPPEGWSIFSGEYKRGWALRDTVRLDEAKALADLLPNAIARNRYLAVETLHYCYELANPDIAGHTISEDILRKMAATIILDEERDAESLANKYRLEFIDLRKQNPAVVKTLNILRTNEMISDDTYFRSLAAIVRLADREFEGIKKP